MRPTWVIGIIGAALVVGMGCAALKQAAVDYRTGATVPLAEGELSPGVRATQDTAPLQSLPYGAVIASIGAFLLGRWYTLQRGQAINRGVAPTTGLTVPGKVLGVLSGLANAVFEIGPNGSAVKRSWKTVLSGLLAYAITLVPAIHTWASTDTTKFGAVVLSITALIMGIEKALSNSQTPVPSANG